MPCSCSAAASRPTAPSKPGSYEPGGAHALAKLLGDQGVDVRTVHTIAEADDEIGEDATLLVTAARPGPGEAVRRAARARRRRRPGDAGGADAARLAAAGAPGRPERRRNVEPQCTVAAAVAAGEVTLGGIGYASPGARSCYPGEDGGGTLLQLADGGGTTTLLGSPAPLTNGGSPNRATRRWRCACSARTRSWSGTCRRPRTRRSTPPAGRSSTSSRTAGTSGPRRRSSPSRCWRCGGRAGSARWSPSRCRSSSARPKRPRAAPGCTGGRRRPGTRARRCGRRRGPGCGPRWACRATPTRRRWWTSVERADRHRPPEDVGAMLVRPAGAGRSRAGPAGRRTGQGGTRGRANLTSGTENATGARDALIALRAEVGKAVVGQDAAVTGLVIALLCRGHVLLEGVPGVAKTLLVRALSAALELETKRVQFTPDLMPGDVTGSLVYDARSGGVLVPRGAGVHQPAARRRDQPDAAEDAGRRCWRRWRSGRSRVDGEPRPLPDPFIVVATQNPVEYEGTYPLPEAQLDRFLLKLTMPLPPRDDEIGVLLPARAGLRPARPRGGGRASAVAGAAELAAGARPSVRGDVGARGARLRRRPVPGHPAVAVAAARRLPARRHRAARGGPGLGVAVRAGLRDPRRRQGAGPARAAAPGRRCGRRPSWRASTADGVLDGVLASVPVPALTMAAHRTARAARAARRAGGRAARARRPGGILAVGGAAGRARSSSTCVLAGTRAAAGASRARATRRYGSASRARSTLVVANPGRPRGARAAAGRVAAVAPAPRRPARRCDVPAGRAARRW